MYEAISQSQPSVGQRVRLTGPSGWPGTEATVNGYDSRGYFTVDMKTATFSGDDQDDDGTSTLGPYWGCLGKECWEIVADGPEQGIPAQDVAAMANPKQAYGDLKVPLQLVPCALQAAAANGLKEGIVKGYGPWNWRKTNVEAMTYVGAIKRHLEAWVDGEEIDPESVIGKHHLDGLAASLAILLDSLKGGFLIDNRPPAGPAPELVRTPKK